MNYNKITILLVDDDDVDVMSVERAFIKHHIKNPLIRAINGLAALELLRGTAEREPIGQPVLILLDINMPVMNGIEFLQVIREDPNLKQIPVVVLSSSDEERDVVSAYNFNVAGYIVKPVEPEQFKDAIRIVDSYWMLCRMPD
ncbi:MAG: response regulator [Firmicutes bacterium]|nr:response regulator [Bacillota bacterium]